MEIFTGMSSTFVLVVSEATTELLLMVLAAVAWLYCDDVCNRMRKLYKSSTFRRGPSAAKVAVKLPTCFENEDAEVEASSSEPEPEAEVFPTHTTGQTPPAPTKRPSPAAPNVPQPASQNETNSSRITVKVPKGFQPQPVLFAPPGLDLPPGLEPGPSQPKDAEKVSTRKKSTTTSNSKPKPQQGVAMRELGRCVCWKDSFGFLVDETGARLFVRQVDVDGEKPLLAGQIVWFRRGGVQAGQTPKAIHVDVVDIEMAKILRAAEKEGIKWSSFQKAVMDGDSEFLANFKSLQNSSTNCKKLTNFKAEAMKGTKDKPKGSPGSHASGAIASVSKAAITTAATGVDGDLKAFLGSGSIEQMRANLKYAPQWVTDKFNAQYGFAK